MRTPSTRVQVFIVWTIICGVIVGALAVIALRPATCFECGMMQGLAGIAAQMAIVIWAIVVVFFIRGFRRPPS